MSNNIKEMADFKENEKRKSKRMGINVKIKLRTIGNSKMASDSTNKEEFEVEVTNISKGGLAFTSSEFLPLNSFYDTAVVLWNKEQFNTAIQVIRIESSGDEDTIIYGCKFIGLKAEDQFKIDVYQIVNEA